MSVTCAGAEYCIHRAAAQRDARHCRFVVDIDRWDCEPAFSGKADLGDDPEPGKRSIIFSPVRMLVVGGRALRLLVALELG